MTHGRDVGLQRNGSLKIVIKILGLIHTFRNFHQSIHIGIIDGAEQFSIKSTDNHNFCTLVVVNLAAVLVEHTVISVLEFDAMTGIHGSLVQDGEN